MKKFIPEAVGWYGMGAALMAYFLVSFSFLPPDGIVYQLLNLTAAAGIAWISLSRKVYQSAVLNIVWSGIALVALIRIVI